MYSASQSKTWIQDAANHREEKFWCWTSVENRFFTNFWQRVFLTQLQNKLQNGLHSFFHNHCNNLPLMPDKFSSHTYFHHYYFLLFLLQHWKEAKELVEDGISIKKPFYLNVYTHLPFLGIGENSFSNCKFSCGPGMCERTNIFLPNAFSLQRSFHEADNEQ